MIDGGESKRAIQLIPPEAKPDGQAMEAFLESAAWSPGVVLLVFPTEEVIFRVLEFPFQEVRKIRQALPFELEDELLDPLEEFTTDFEAIPLEDGGCRVPVYLIKRNILKELVDVLEQRGFSVLRTTFSAQVLIGGEPEPAGRQFLVYLGTEEGFVALQDTSRLEMVESLATWPGEMTELVREGQYKTPRELRDYFGENDNGESENGKNALKPRLEAAVYEINRFISLYQMGEPYTIAIQGFFAPYIEQLDTNGETRLKVAENMSLASSPPFFGVLGNLAGDSRDWVSTKGISFYHTLHAWMGQLRDFRAPLFVGGALLLVLILIGGGRLIAYSSSLSSRMEVLNQQVKTTLKVPLPENSKSVKSALDKLSQEVSGLRKEKEAAARFSEYHYDVLRLVQGLSKVMKDAPQMTVEGVSYNGERFTLFGVTQNYSDSEGLRAKLLELPQFADFTGKVNHSKSGQTIRYRITIQR